MTGPGSATDAPGDAAAGPAAPEAAATEAAAGPAAAEGAARAGPVPPKRLRAPPPAVALNFTTRSTTLAPALRPLATWVSPPLLTPVVIAVVTCLPPVTATTVAFPPE